MSAKRAHVRPKWKRSTLNTAVALAISSMCAAPAWSAIGPCGTNPVTISTSVGACDGTGISSITVAAPSGAITTSYSTALYYGTGLSGSLSNSGIINAARTDIGSVYNSAVSIGGDLSGTLTNNLTGTIYANANANPQININTTTFSTWVSAYAYATGQGVNLGNLSGTLTNHGLISATAYATAYGGSSNYAYARATGIGMGSLNAGATLTNTGTISAHAQAYGSSFDSADAYGVHIDSNLSGTLDNQGTISATASDSYYANAYAISMGDIDTGTLTNSGTIQASANTQWGNANANGIEMGDINAGRALTNSDTISAYGFAYYGNAYAQGIYMGTLYGTLNNQGSGSVIEATAIATSGNSAHATAISVSGIASGGSLTNGGTIKATAEGGYSSGSANGISISSFDAGGSLTNSGMISATASGYYYAYGHAIGINSDLSGTLTNNSGATIGASASAWSSSAYATGVYLGSITSTGKLTNGGTISASASGNSYGSAYAAGISMNNIEAGGSLTNSGTISAYGYTYYGNAYAKGIDMGTLSGTLKNQGAGSAIEATAIATSGNSAYAIAISMSGIASGGTLTNGGTIKATADEGGSSIAIATGIHIGSFDAGGSLTNSGTIEAAAIGNFAYAYGIRINSNLDGTLTNNSGATIRATATAQSISGSAIGVNFGSITSSGTLTNSGTIEASASLSWGGGASAYGLSGFNLDGTLTNSSGATMRASASGSSATAYATGVALNAITGTGALTNSGTIEATADSLWGGAYAYGLSIASMGGTLTNNSGATIRASASGLSNPLAYGVELNNIAVTGALTNNGMIEATADSLLGGANAYGLSVNTVDGTLTNSSGATIRATASGSSAIAYAYGAALSYITGTGALTNSGMIEATADSLSGNATAHGLSVGNLDGTLNNNSGATIRASASAPSGNAYAYGVDLNSITSIGALDNKGTIAAFASGTADAAYGVLINTMSGGTLTNSGTISGASASYAGNGYSVYVGNGTGTIDNQAAGWLFGALYAGGSVNVTNSGTIVIPSGANANISGNYTQTASGALGFGATSPGSYGTMYVNGTADLSAVNNTIAMHATLNNTLAVNDALANVVDSSNTLAGAPTPGSAVTIASTPLVTFTGTVNSGGTGIDVTVTSVNTMAGVYGSLGTLGGALDSYAATGYGTNANMDALIDAFNNMNSAGQMTGAMQDLQPLMSAGMNHVTSGVLYGVNRVIRARQNDYKGLSSGDDFFTNRNGWVKLIGSWAKQEDSGLILGYKANTGGIGFGADGEISSASRLGAALVFTHTTVDSNTNHQNVKMDGYQLIGYGTHNLSPDYSLDWQVDYGSNTNKGNRNLQSVGINAASADYKSSSYHLGVGVGHPMPMGGGTTLVPTVRADYTSISEDAYTDSSGSTTNSRTTSEFVIGASGKVLHPLSESSRLVADLGVDYNTQAKQSKIETTLPNGGAAFTAQGIEPSKATFVGGLGLVVNSSETTEITARYDFAARSGYAAQTASLKLKMLF
jgi:hypothetical protein